LRIEIGRYDDKLSTLGLFGGDLREQVLADVAGNEFALTRISKQARPEKSGTMLGVSSRLSAMPLVYTSRNVAS
jgi:hypothetical protein